MSDLSAQKWGYMRVEVDSVRTGFEGDAFAKQSEIENKAAELYAKSPKKGRKYLTSYTNEFALKATTAYWDLGDFLWWKYTGKF